MILCPKLKITWKLYGDLNGQINARDLGTKLLNELLDQYGEQIVQEATLELKRASCLVRSYISKLPDGEFEVADLAG